jgi:hypothetical protein
VQGPKFGPRKLDMAVPPLSSGSQWGGHVRWVGLEIWPAAYPITSRRSSDSFPARWDRMAFRVVSRVQDALSSELLLPRGLKSALGAGGGVIKTSFPSRDAVPIDRKVTFRSDLLPTASE